MVRYNGHNGRNKIERDLSWTKASGPLSFQRGRVPLTIPLGISALLLVFLVLKESDLLSALGISPAIFRYQEVSSANTDNPPVTVKEGTLTGNPIDDEDDIEEDEVVSREALLSSRRGAESDDKNDLQYSMGGSGPITQLIRSKELEDEIRRREAEAAENGVEGEAGDPRDVPFSDVLSSLEGEDDEIISSGRIFGVRVQSGLGGDSSGGADSGSATGTPNATPGPNETPRPWVTGQARGYTMLYAMHPKARGVVDTQVATLLRARVREPHVGVLIDGTFTRDFEYLKTVIDRLSQDGRRVRLTLYLTNGPAMRRFETTRIVAPFSKIDPERFRTLIRNDNSVREQFVRIVNDAARIFRYNLEVHPENSNVAVVMLEDNLDWDSYNRMRLLSSRTLSRVATFARNPCVGCYSGNDSDPQGDAREEHNLSFFNQLRRGDAYSFDGVGFAYPGQSLRQGEVSSDQVIEVMRASVRQGLQYVGLWRAPWQGIVEGQDLIPPEERTFIASTPEEQLFEITALRAGLSEEVPPIV
jgi:hypothetical protein